MTDRFDSMVAVLLGEPERLPAIKARRRLVRADYSEDDPYARGWAAARGVPYRPAPPDRVRHIHIAGGGKRRAPARSPSKDTK